MFNKLTLFVALFSIVLFTTQCGKKECSPRSVSSEASEMQAFASANAMDALPHPSGLYYEIIASGTGPNPSPNDSVVITYTGKFLNGQTFDEQLTPNNDPANGRGPWPLVGLIQGWQIGLPLIKKGGRIKLLVPSSLGYGCSQYFSIPGNSILYFDIQLVDIQ